MSVPAVYLPEAEGDIELTFEAYEKAQVGLGDRFAEAIRDQVEKICSNPQLYGVFRRGIRASTVRGFPFVIYYRDRGDAVLIVAVQHGRRSSRRWRGRI
jgi:toxin ParE1/3/4